MTRKSCAVIVLAGGKSERMKFPKPFLDFDGRTFIEKISDTYFEAGIEANMLVLNTEFLAKKWEFIFNKIFSSFEVVMNDEPHKGRFHSIKLGIKHVLDHEFCFIQNIDNPFVNLKIIKSLWELRNPNGYSAPVYKKQSGHPILISNKVIWEINQMNESELKLNDFLKKFEKTEVEVNDDSVLMNINSPEDYKHFVKDEINT